MRPARSVIAVLVILLGASVALGASKKPSFEEAVALFSDWISALPAPTTTH